MTMFAAVKRFADYLLTLDIHEVPARSNWAVPITSWAQQYGYSYGDAWCSWTTSFILNNVDPALVDGNKSGASVSWLNWGKQTGRVIPGPVPGAIDVMDHDDDPSWTDHVGLVREVHADGTWVNWEGNHNDRYMTVPRNHSDARHYFILPRYSETPPPKPKVKEYEMALVTSGVRVPSFGAIFNCGMMGGELWDVWAKVQNPTATPMTALFTATTNSTNEHKSVSVPANQIVQVQIGKEMKGKDNTLVVIEPSVPAICTFDHRPIS